MKFITSFEETFFFVKIRKNLVFNTLGDAILCNSLRSSRKYSTLYTK
jgi:hypothetical protein